MMKFLKRLFKRDKVFHGKVLPYNPCEKCGCKHFVNIRISDMPLSIFSDIPKCQILNADCENCGHELFSYR